MPLGKCVVKQPRHTLLSGHKAWQGCQLKLAQSTPWREEQKQESRWMWTPHSIWLQTCWSWNTPRPCWWRRTISGCWQPASPANTGREPELRRSRALLQRRLVQPGQVLCCLERWSFPRANIWRHTPWRLMCRELEQSTQLVWPAAGPRRGHKVQTLQDEKWYFHL